MNAGVTACSLDTHEGDLAAVPIAMEVQGLAGYITTDGIIDVSCLVFSTASLVEVSIIAKSEWIDGCMQGLWPAALTCVRVAVSSAMKVPGSAGYITRGSITESTCLLFSTASVVEVSIIAKSGWMDRWLHAGVMACSLDMHEGDLVAVPIVIDAYTTALPCILALMTLQLSATVNEARNQWMQGSWPAALICMRATLWQCPLPWRCQALLATSPEAASLMPICQQPAACI